MSSEFNGRLPLADDVKKRLKPLIIELRCTLEEDLERELRRLGLDGSKDSPVPVEKLSYLADQERAIRIELEAILVKEQESIGSFAGALEAVRREAAYTHLNRLVGLKCLELRGHLVIEGERTEAVTCRAEFGGRSKWLWTLRSRHSQYRHGAQAEELLWREGLLQACAAITEEIGVIFDPANPYAQVWPSFRTLRAVVDRLNELPEEAYRTDEFLGWVYQYFQTEEKEKVTAGESFTQKLKKTKKYTGPDIATYTALYTERYMVDFLLQNSIGSYWMEMYPDSRANEGWLYYVTPETHHTRAPKPLKEWKILDPAMGSGHFLVVAFDLLAQLYAEERQMEVEGRLPKGWSVPENQTACVILENNLHGIDIDLRAVQLAALALYLKAKEQGWEEAGVQPRLNLVVADAVLTRGEAYEHLLTQYKDDPAIQEAIRVIWHSLEHVRELGSLVRVDEELEAAIRKMKAKEDRDIPLISSSMDWEGYKQILFEHLRDVFNIENQSTDMTSRIIGMEGRKSVGLLELLSQQYYIVCTNPPYMGSGNMGDDLKNFITKHYQQGKKDLYAAFILRCQELTEIDGYMAMVTQQSWMFLRTFAKLRNQITDNRNKFLSEFTGLLKEVTFETIAHLGPGAFREISGEVVNIVLFTLLNIPPSNNHKFTAFRLISNENKPGLLIHQLRNQSAKGIYKPAQSSFLSIPGTPIVYWLSQKILDLLSTKKTIADYGFMSWGISSSNNNRFLRFWWEILDPKERWLQHAKGGGYGRWTGLVHHLMDWDNNGSEMKKFILSRYPYLKNNYEIKIRPYTFGKYGWTYSSMSGRTLGARFLLPDQTTNAKSPAIFTDEPNFEIGAILNSRLASYIIRSLSTSINVDEGYVGSIPLPPNKLDHLVQNLVELCVKMKSRLLTFDPIDRSFTEIKTIKEKTLTHSFVELEFQKHRISAILHTFEGIIENKICEAYQISGSDLQDVLDETSIPVGWYSPLDNYTELTR
jgi:hypothetical protein